ncbi:hypothetical protein PRIPAC_81096 [Pristionchus pacificus]|uniref:Uncharacterized protein n=1 Tax=Pristionchus pacificus TaxID=54126 RepID=A0A2A6CM26_PRIPA|nr:hypothetical protein PRIPAC_81096 [Pristionchus pacificus]|eukprot:PDM79159.1 hypothetical protein PRIPAC_31738 [Pristionchus pacificus]
MTPPGFRILAISKCLFDNTYFSISMFLMSTEELSASSNDKAETIELVVNSTSRVTLPVAERPRTIKEGKVEVCFNVAAFWYDDWPRLIVFIELWRAAQNAQYVNANDAIIVNMRQNLVRTDFSDMNVDKLPFFSSAFKQILLDR